MKKIVENVTEMMSHETLMDTHHRIDEDKLQTILEKLSLNDRLRQARKIIIKPNFAGGSAVPLDSHAVSDVVFLRQLVESIHAANPMAGIVIAESDSAGPGFAYQKFEHLGLTQWHLPYLTLLDLSRDILDKIENLKFRYFGLKNGQLYLSRQLMECDFFISAANLKTHAVTKFTGGCKNLFGLLPRTEKYYYHTHISDVVHDLYWAKTPDLTIVDAFYGMEGNGPIVGTPINLGFRLWGVNAAECDVIGASIIGIPPWRVTYLTLILGRQTCCKFASLPLPRCRVRFRGKMLAFFNSTGLWLQQLGDGILMYGHRSHSAYSIPLWIYLTMRPVLIKFVSLERLKEWRKKWRH